MCRYITSSLISCACARTNGRLAVAVARTRTRRCGACTRFTVCLTSSGSARLTTMPPSGIGAPVSRFPELAEIDDLLQALRLVGEAVLVNDQPGVERPSSTRRLDVRKHQLGLVLRRRKRQAAAGNCAVVYLPGIAIVRSPARTSSRRDRALRDQQRPAVAPSALPASSST